MKKLNLILIALVALVVTACSSTPKQLKEIADKHTAKGGEACYYILGKKECKPVPDSYWFEFKDGSMKGVYSNVWSQYKIGDKYP